MKDRDLWHQVAKTVKPLKGKTVAKHLPDSPSPRGLVVKPRPFAVPLPSHHAGGQSVDASTLHKFRAGKMHIAGRIDLHGMTQDEAHRALTRFLHFSYHNGRRCVLVITGKGNSTGGGGILKRMVPLWLDEETLRPCVLATAPAKHDDGGAGAMYILLRRRREA